MEGKDMLDASPGSYPDGVSFCIPRAANEYGSDVLLFSVCETGLDMFDASPGAYPDVVPFGTPWYGSDTL